MCLPDRYGQIRHGRWQTHLRVFAAVVLFVIFTVTWCWTQGGALTHATHYCMLLIHHVNDFLMCLSVGDKEGMIVHFHFLYLKQKSFLFSWFQHSLQAGDSNSITTEIMSVKTSPLGLWMILIVSVFLGPIWLPITGIINLQILITNIYFFFWKFSNFFHKFTPLTQICFGLLVHCCSLLICLFVVGVFSSDEDPGQPPVDPQH